MTATKLNVEHQGSAVVPLRQCRMCAFCGARLTQARHHLKNAARPVASVGMTATGAALHFCTEDELRQSGILAALDRLSLPRSPRVAAGATLELTLQVGLERFHLSTSITSTSAYGAELTVTSASAGWQAVVARAITANDVSIMDSAPRHAVAR